MQFQHRYENLTDKLELLTLTNTIFVEHVDIIGNYGSIYIYGCSFPKGLRILGKEQYKPRLIRISDCITSPVNWFLHPLKINNAEYIFIDNVRCIGNGMPYSIDIEGGPADLFSINNSIEVQLSNCVAIDGGENGYSINGCHTVSIKDSLAMGNDGQGFHIGRHEEPVEIVRLVNIQTVSNWKNQANTNGKGCGVLLHNIKDASLLSLYTAGHEYGVSFMNREREGALLLSGKTRNKYTITTSKNIKVIGGLEVLPLIGN